MKALQARSTFLGASIVVLVAVLAAALALVGVRAFAQEGDGTAPAAVGEVTATTLRLTYQGRLLDPATGRPKPDGSYGLTFRLYNLANGGTALWTEARTGANAVAVSKGAFSVELGSVTALPAIFNGQDLWLGITGTTQAGDDAEMIPRQRITWQAYALNADRLDGLDQSAFSRTTHSHTVRMSAMQCDFHLLLHAGRSALSPPSSLIAPVAAGFVESDGSFYGKYVAGIAQVVWNEVTDSYEVHFDLSNSPDGQPYDPVTYVANVTPVYDPVDAEKCDGVMVRTGYIRDGDILVIQFLRPSL
jgi:hypothetical protein